MRRAAVWGAAVVALAGMGLLATGIIGASPPVLAVVAAPVRPVAPPAIATTTTTVPTPVAPPPAVTPGVPVSTVLATPVGSVAAYVSPGGPTVGPEGTWYGYKMVFPVVDRVPGWVEVRLPQRPNGTTAWIAESDVTLSATDMAVVVDLGHRRVTLYRAGTALASFPAGIGTASTPTPTGHYFVAVHEPRAVPGYGPFILDLSAHSNAIRSWEGSGDAIIALHGPITAAADALIGTTGAAVSNGCVRLHDADLAQLAAVPLGTPVDINA